MAALWLAVWRVLAVNVTFEPVGEAKALWRALLRSVWPWAVASVGATSLPGRVGRLCHALLPAALNTEPCRVAGGLVAQFYAARWAGHDFVSSGEPPWP